LAPLEKEGDAHELQGVMIDPSHAICRVVDLRVGGGMLLGLS
jgi:hypothetical protein